MKFNFLIASERSGSNLITKLIDGNSKYCAPSPPHTLRAFYDKWQTYGNLNCDENWQKLVKDFLDFFNLQIGTWSTKFSFEELYKSEDRSINSLLKKIYKKEAQFLGKPNAFIKEVKTYNLFNYINEYFPESKFVYLTRDPRDMVLSWKKSPVHRGDLVRATNVWQNDQKESLKLLNKYKERILLIKYEDLISNQKVELVKICNHLDVEFEDSMLDFHKNKLSIKNSQKTDNWKNLNKKIITNNSKKYLTDLTDSEIKYVEYVCWEEMQQLIYKTEFPKIKLTQFKKIEKELLKKERHTKPEYDLISDEEKIKRQNWMSKYRLIKEKK